MRIGITYNLKSDLASIPGLCLPDDAAEEFDLPETIEALQKVLEEEGHEVFPLGGDLTIIEKLREGNIDFVFNIAEGFRGRNRESQIPALLELVGIPYSGSDPLGLALTLDKALAKRVATSLGIPTPEFWVVGEPQEAQEIPNRFPLFVKPLWQGSSKGIQKTSRVEDGTQLNQEISRLFKDYPREPVLVEDYIAGREFTVGLVGNDPPEIIGIMEISPRNSAEKDFFYSLEAKRNWRALVEYHYPPDLAPQVEEGIQKAALRLFKVLGLRDVARFDFRLNPEGKFYFLEANPLPGLSPESGDLVILAQKKGWSYQELILKIIKTAILRYPQLVDLKEIKIKP